MKEEIIHKIERMRMEDTIQVVASLSDKEWLNFAQSPGNIRLIKIIIDSTFGHILNKLQ